MGYQTFLGVLLGLGTSISWYALLSFLPIAKNVDGSVHAEAIALRHQEDYSKEVVIFGMDDISGGAAQYASMFEDLLSVSKAKAIIINPPRHWYGRTEDDNEALWQVINRYQDRIVLSSVTAPIDAEYKTAISLHNYMVRMATSEGIYKPEVEAEVLHGFFEFAYQPRQSVFFDSPANKHSLEGRFARDDNSEDIDLKSVAFLTFDKLLQHSEGDVTSLPYRDSVLISTAKVQTPIQNLDSQIYNLFEVCDRKKFVSNCRLSEKDEFSDLEGKFVLFGYTNVERSVAEAHIMTTPQGEMSAAEIQANHILGLQTGEVYLFLNNWVVVTIVAAGGIVFGRVITTGISNLRNSKMNRQIVCRTLISISVLFFCYAVLSIMSLFAGVLMPVFAPISSWIVAIITSSMILLYRDQNLAIERQISEERKAVIDQASGQLQNIAHRVHQEALQHIKLAMDWLEIMQNQNPACDASIPLNKILLANESIRGNLFETRLCAEKLAIAPELRLGLPKAIELYTKRLKRRGELALERSVEVDSIQHDAFNSRWEVAREGIFSFYQEAMSNVMHHAQPPRGQATWVKVRLDYRGDTASLTVTNNGSFPATYLDDATENFGTQVMRNIANRLPNGRLLRSTSTEGNFQVELSWSMKEFLSAE